MKMKPFIVVCAQDAQFPYTTRRMNFGLEDLDLAVAQFYSFKGDMKNGEFQRVWSYRTKMPVSA